MDQPSENPDGYNSGSVLTYADQFKGKLLITHGALDDNVHMQNTIEFVQILQKESKDFDMMIYPNQRHGIRGAWRPHAIKEEVSFWFRHFLDEEFVN
jgi:dipeptidyl-peptidase-4